MGVRRVFTVASMAAIALIAQGSGALALVPPSADMAITMTGPATATAGTDITYLITLTNNGPDPADGAAFNPVAPANTTYVSLTKTSGPPPSLSVPAGTIYTFTWVLHVNPSTPGGTVISNTVTISATTADPNPANNSATVLTTVAGLYTDLGMIKTADVSALTGDRFSSRIFVLNNGPYTAVSVVVVDNLPAGLTGVAFATPGTSLGLSDGCTNDLAGHINCHIAAMQVGQTFILDVSGIAATPGDYTDTASVSSALPDPNTGNNDSFATTHVLARPSDGGGGGGDHNSQTGSQSGGQSGNGDHNGQSANGDHGDKSGSGGRQSSSGQSHDK